MLEQEQITQFGWTRSTTRTVFPGDFVYYHVLFVPAGFMTLNEMLMWFTGPNLQDKGLL